MNTPQGLSLASRIGYETKRLYEIVNALCNKTLELPYNIRADVLMIARELNLIVGNDDAPEISFDADENFKQGIPPNIEKLSEEHQKILWELLENPNTLKATILSEDEIKIKVMNHLLLKERAEATELMVSQILAREYIYTLRQDNTESEIWIYSDGIYVPQAKTFITEFIRKVLGEIFTTTFTNQVISKIEADTYINQEDFFKEEDWHLIPVMNGIIDIRDLENKDLKNIRLDLLPFSSRYRFFNKLPIEYSPDKDCPNIKEFLKNIMNEKDVPVIQEIFGFLPLRKYLLKKALMIVGDGDNGKSKLLKVMELFVGSENNVSIPLQQFDEDNFALAGLHGKLSNICSDLSQEALRNSSNFRAVTGGDTVTAARKFLTPITFENYAKLMYSTNKLPRTFDTDIDAFFNRWIILIMTSKFLPQKEIDMLEETERDGIRLADPDITEKITNSDELSGLLNYALEGLQRILRKKDFSYSKSTADVKELWIRKADSFAAFLIDEITCDETTYDDILPKKDLRKKYAEYCRTHKLRSVGDKQIKYVLETTFGIGEEQTGDEHIRCWVGIRFKNEEELNENKKKEIEKKESGENKESSKGICDTCKKKVGNRFRERDKYNDNVILWLCKDCKEETQG